MCRTIARPGIIPVAVLRIMGIPRVRSIIIPRSRINRTTAVPCTDRPLSRSTTPAREIMVCSSVRQRSPAREITVCSIDLQCSHAPQCSVRLYSSALCSVRQCSRDLRCRHVPRSARQFSLALRCTPGRQQVLAHTAAAAAVDTATEAVFGNDKLRLVMQ